jgi:hypothetical protein
LDGQVRVTAGAGSTENVAEQTTSDSQSEETVHVTVADPPQNEGAEGALLVIVALHPPENVAVASHAV